MSDTPPVLDRAERGRRGVAALRARFADLADPEHRLPDDEREALGRTLHRQYMADLSAKGAAASMPYYEEQAKAKELAEVARWAAFFGVEVEA